MPVSPRSFGTEGKEFVSCLYGLMQTAAQKKARHFLKESAPPQTIRSFSRDRGRHELFCTSLCACRCPRAARDRKIEDRVARSVIRVVSIDEAEDLSSNNDPPPDTSSRRPTCTRYLPDWGMAGARRSLPHSAGAATW